MRLAFTSGHLWDCISEDGAGKYSGAAFRFPKGWGIELALGLCWRALGLQTVWSCQREVECGKYQLVISASSWRGKVWL